jgi:hypothetical protein
LIEQDIDDLLVTLRDADRRREFHVRDEVCRDLVAMGSPAVAHLIGHLEQIDWDTLDTSEDDACMRALAHIGDEIARRYVIQCASDLVVSRSWGDARFFLGVAAFDAMGLTADPEMHEVLVELVTQLDTELREFDTFIWHLVDAARPFLDERARPTLLKLIEHPDTQDIQPSARQALATLDSRRER